MNDQIRPVGMTIVGPQHGIGYKDDEVVLINDLKEFEQNMSVKLEMNVLLFCLKGRMQLDVDNETCLVTVNTLLICRVKSVITNIMSSSDYKGEVLLLTDGAVQNILQSDVVQWKNMLYVEKIKQVELTEEWLRRTACYGFLLQNRVSSNILLNRAVVYALLRAVLLELCEIMLPKEENTDTDERELRSEELFHRFVGILSNEPKKKRSVTYYAKQLFISPKYLSTVCKLMSDKSPIQWITEYVMEDIRSYLKNTNLSCKEISELLNFPNASFFGRYVREHTSMSPIDYRLSLRR